MTGNIDGFAVSPDGSKLAISVAAVYRHYRLAEPSKVEMFSLATGAGRTWTWGNHGSAGWIEPFAQSLSWAADSRTLLFEGTASTAFTVVYLLDTAAAGGSMPGAARQVHIAGHEPAEWSGNERGTGDRMLVTGNGLLVAAVGIRTAHGRPVSSQWARYEAEVTQLNKAIARAHGHPAAQARLRRRLQSTRTAYYEAGQEAETSVSMIAEFSLRTGKVVRVMSRNYEIGRAHV